jgi:hypothetical protein
LAWLSRRPTQAASWDRLWIDFRNTFGAVWGLRVMERFNVALRANDCALQLTWHGLEPEQSDPAGSSVSLRPEIETAVARHLRPLLRRFVSDAWIASRIGELPNEAEAD